MRKSGGWKRRPRLSRLSKLLCERKSRPDFSKNGRNYIRNCSVIFDGGVAAAQLVKETLDNMKIINGFFLKVSIEELNKYLGNASDPEGQL